MADETNRDDVAPDTADEGGEATLNYGAELEEQIVDALEAGDTAQVRDVVGQLHYADCADLLERLSSDKRRQIIDLIRDDLDAEVLSELDDMVREEVVEFLGVRELAVALVELDSDDAVEVLTEMHEDQQREVLDAIPEADRALIEEGLSYPEDSAGRLMQREMVMVPTFWNVGQTIDFMRQTADDEEEEDGLPDTFYDIFVIDPKGHPQGTISLSRLLRTRRPIGVKRIMETDLNLIPVEMDQEDVAFLFRQRDLVSAPVVDADGRLVGNITVDDVVDVIHEEHEEDVLRMGGVIEDDLYHAVLGTTKARFSWLVVNLLTAILASLVIGLFDATIEEVVALAILMPIVASMGGNAGTQTLTVTVRALATKELTSTNAMRVVGKELVVGIINGLLFAVLTGGVAWAWFGNPMLGGVIAMAMVVNMIVAGLAGTTIPLALDRFGADPAVASSVFLTTLTDVVGFFAFLGLAAVLLF